MKPQKEITFSVALLFLSQNVFFPNGVYAQSTAAQVIGAAGSLVTQIPGMYSQKPDSPAFMTEKLKSQMNMCLADGIIGITGNDPKSIDDLTQKWSKAFSKKGDATETSANKCDAKCEVYKDMLANLPEEPSCNTYGTARDAVGSEITTRSPKSAAKELPKTLEKMQAYVSCLAGKQGCADVEQAALAKQVKAFNCQMQALQGAVQEASQALQISLQANQKVYGQMSQYQKELGEQMQQVDEILGPDPELNKSGNSQFQGLLGLQKELNDSLPKMVEAEAKFKTDIEKLKNDTKTNEQNLEATRVNVASSCIKGSRNVGVSGGYSLTCFKPVTIAGKDGASSNAVDRNGNVKYSKQPCGPYDYIRSKIEQRAFVTSRGIQMNERRRENSAQNAVAFDSLVDSINRAMGDYDQKGSDNARLDTDVHSWGDIESKVSGNIDSVASQSGVDVRSMLRAVAGHCFQEADSWKNKQLRSSSSDYGKKKAELKAMQTNMTAQMDTGITSMNKTYGDVMGVMFNKHVTLSRAQCTKDNPELMSDCFSKIRQNVQNLLEGNGALTTTAKQIKGGPMTPGFSVQCRGLNGCVTAFKNVRDSQKSYIRARQKDKESFVGQSNDMTKTQLTNLTSQLSAMQNSLLAQYDAMKGSFMKLGIDAPEKPKFMDPEQLQNGEGPDKSMGPFQNPKSMSAVLSGMMQPGGMVNFGDTGLRDIQKQIAEKAKEKSSKSAEELKTYRAMASKYNNIADECGIVGLGGESDRVGGISETCEDATRKANSCGGSLQKNGVSAGISELDLKKAQLSKTKLESEITKLSDEKTALKDKKDETSKNRVIAIDSRVATIEREKTEVLATIEVYNEQETKHSVSQTDEENLKVLSELGAILNKMSINGDKNSYKDLEKFDMTSLYGLTGNDCIGVIRAANKCKVDGKGIYTEKANDWTIGETVKANGETKK